MYIPETEKADAKWLGEAPLQVVPWEADSGMEPACKSFTRGSSWDQPLSKPWISSRVAQRGNQLHYRLIFSDPTENSAAGVAFPSSPRRAERTDLRTLTLIRL